MLLAIVPAAHRHGRTKRTTFLAGSDLGEHLYNVVRRGSPRVLFCVRSSVGSSVGQSSSRRCPVTGCVRHLLVLRPSIVTAEWGSVIIISTH